MKTPRWLKRTFAVMAVLAAIVFAQVPTSANTSDGKVFVSKASTMQVAIKSERTFNVEGKIMAQLAVERLDADWSAIVLPEAPVSPIDHVPLV